MNEVVYNLYLTLSHLKACTKQISHVNYIYDAVLSESNSTYELECYFSSLYEKEINNVGKFLNHKFVLHSTEFLYNKTKEEVLNDLLFIADCIIISTAVKLNLRNSIFDVIKEMQENDN